MKKQSKGKKTLALIITVIMVIGLMPGAGTLQAFAADTVPPTGTYTIGSETVTAYELSTADHLYWFANQVNSGSTTINAVLTADIVVNTNVLDANGDLNSGSFTSWTPIGNETNMYDGKFDGKGHTISGLYVNKPTDGIHIGLFGFLNTQACIYRVGVVDSYFNGNGTIGGFCGSTSGDNGRATIQYCYTTATVKGESMVGGFCGYSNNALLYRCFSAGKVSGTNYVGPFFGGTQGDATRCYALADAEGSFSGVGYKTADQFASGEVAYLLNYPDNGDASYWKQIIGTDSIPQYSGKIVYYGEGQYHNHTDDITHCLRCGAMETLNGVYQIKTKDQLYWFAALVNGTDGLTQNASAKAVLKADITVDSDWTPIGDSTAFTGSFDGGNYTVSGLTNSLFGSIGSGANVSGIGVSGGGLCTANSGTIENCSVSGTGSVALCSGSNTGTIANCYAAGGSGTKLYSSSSGTVINCYTLAGNTAAAVGGTVLTTISPFTSGEVAYLLNQGASGHPGGVWGQDIGTDSLPLLGGETVYYNQNAKYHNHDGYCADCDIVPEYDGTNGGYQISNVDELYWFANKVNSGSTMINAVLTADITVNTNVLDANGDLNRGNFKEWTPIGKGEYYMGNFDGQGHTISGLYVNAESTNRIGLFSALDTDSSVKNVNIVDSYFKGDEYVGGVCGRAYNGTVSNCTNSGTVSGNNYVGGVCGDVSNGTVSNCTNSGAVSGSGSMVGGVCGYVYNSTVSNCTNSDTVSGNDIVGGVCGYVSNGTVSNCTNRGTVSGNNEVGGVCGNNNAGVVRECTNSGAVSGNANVGGVCGWNTSEYNGTDKVTVGTVSNCTNSGTVSGGFANVGGVCGHNDAGVVRECTNSGAVSGSYGNVGGVCGLNEVFRESVPVSNRADTGTVSNCKNTGAVSGGSENVGGVCGNNYGYENDGIRGTVSGCINSGAVSGSDWFVGGVCGKNYAGVVRECTNSGAVSGSGSEIGGVCGSNDSTSDINGCYNSGSVNGDSYVGGVCGYNQKSTIGNSYYNSDIYSGGAVGYNSGTVGNDVLGKTTAQFTGGEVCYLLNGSSSENSIWYQNIDLADAIADAYPVLDNAHGIVYPCTGCTAVYSNTQGRSAEHSFKPAEGGTTHKCEKCGATENHSTTNFTYTADENANQITVYCNEGGCGANIGYVELAAPSGTLTYDGSAKTATVSDTVNDVDFSSTASITYKQGETILTSAPKDAGTYTASITLGTATVSVEFTIDSATPAISWGSNTSQTAAYTGNPIAPSKLTAPLINGETYSGEFQYSYRVKDSSDAFTAGLPTDCGIYEVKASIVADGNYTAAETESTMTLTIDWLATEAAAELTDQSDNTLTGDSWWAQSVTFKAPTGYTISNSVSGTYGMSFVYDTQTGAEGTTVTYYLKNSDGEIAEKSATVRIDKTAPTWPENGGINIKENRWKELLSSISFGLFYKETVDVKVCANDSLSGVTAYCYYIDSTGGAVKTAEQLNALNFTEYAVEVSTVNPVTVTSLSSDGNYVVYAYAVDKAGNKSAYVCTNGVVIDMTAPVISGIAAPSKDASTLTDTGAQISFTGSEAGTYFYIVMENGETAPASITDFATENVGDGNSTWAAKTGVTSAAMTADAGNKIILSGLNANTAYTLYLAAVDSLGNYSAVYSQGFTTCMAMPTITVNPTISGTYGQMVSEMTLTPGTAKIEDATISGTWELTDTNASDMPVVGTKNTYVVTFKPADSQYETVTVQVTPAVEAKPITVTADNKSKTYGENNPDLTFTVPDGALAGSDTVTDLAVALTCTATASSPVTTEGYAITGTSTSTNYHVTVTPGTLTITRADAQITVGTTTYDKTFGDAAFPLSGVTDTNTDIDVQYAVTTGADVVSVSDGTVTILKAGTAKITVSLPASTNYNAAASKTITVNVAKKTGYTVDAINKTYAYKKGNTDTIDLSGLLPSDCGSVAYGTPQVTGALYTEDGAPSVSDGKLSYTVTEGDTDKTGTITVTVSSENYADFTITVNVTLKGRIPVEIAAIGITDKTDSGANVYLSAIDEGEYGIDNYYLYYTTEPLSVVTAKYVKENGTASPTGTFVLSGLPEDTAYYLYAIAEDTYGNASAVWADRFTTWVKAPEISPAGGSYVGSVSVSLSAGDGTTIYYTTDGSEPTTESTEYTQAFTLTASATVKAIAVKGNNSSVTTQAQFTIITGGLPTTPTDNVTQAGDTTTADLTGSTVSKGGETATTVDQTTADKIVDKAASNNSEEVVINAETKNSSAASSTKSAEVTLPAETLGAIAEKTDADVVIKTDVAEVRLDAETVEAVAAQAAAGETVSIIAEKVKEGAKEVRYELKVVTSSGKVISDFNGGSVSVTVNVPASLSGKNLVCVYIDDNGYMHKVEGMLNADGTYTFITGHFSQYALMEEDDADDAIEAQKAEVEGLKLTLRSQLVTMKSGKKAVKLTWTGGEDIRLDGIEIFRSLKRYSGYGKEPFFTTAKTAYYNTAVKAGTRYYYRVRGFVTIDGEKVYTQYSTKAWRTVK